MGLTLLTLLHTCSPDARGGNDYDSGNDDDNKNNSGGDLAHARVTQDLALIPYK